MIDKKSLILTNLDSGGVIQLSIHLWSMTRNFIEKKTKNQKYVCLTALDLKRAFDCIWTNWELQKKIRYSSKNDNITNWFDSYFNPIRPDPLWVLNRPEPVPQRHRSRISGLEQPKAQKSCYPTNWYHSKLIWAFFRRVFP